jgi:hypothetical protein
MRAVFRFPRGHADLAATIALCVRKMMKLPVISMEPGEAEGGAEFSPLEVPPVAGHTATEDHAEVEKLEPEKLISVPISG